MKYANQNLASDLYISPKWVSIALIGLGTILFFIDSPHFGVDNRIVLILYAILLVAIASTVWLLDDQYLRSSQWFLVTASIAMVFTSLIWFGEPNLLILCPLPIVLATALLGFRSAFITTLVETVILAVAWVYFDIPTNIVMLIVTVLSLWSVLGLIGAILQRAQAVIYWSLEQYQEARLLLDESRHQKADLATTQEDLVRANRQLNLLNERLAVMRLAAEEAQQAKTIFVAKVSHEFRTPLNMIIGLIDALTDNAQTYNENLPAALIRDLNIVRRNSEHLAGMVNDVLALSQAERGHLTLEREWIDLTEDINNSISIIKPLLEKKQLSLQVNMAELPEVYCDRTRIRQVILNLLSNAARYTQQGGITLLASADGRHFAVRVEDTGPGISANDAKLIFEPFQQSSRDIWRDKDGFGLGLNISKHFIESHDGEIWFESELGQGSTFCFKIPISPKALAQTDPARWVDQDWVFRERTSQAKLPQSIYEQRLVICDETAILHALFSSYSNKIELIDTTNLPQAILELQQVPAHALIVNAPTWHDAELMIEKARKSIADTPILGCILPDKVDQALDAGVIKYLIKPIVQENFIEALQTLGMPIKDILLVDDNPDLRNLYTRMLLTYDRSLNLSTAANGVEALEKLRQHPPDLIFLDIVMPELNGWQLLEQKKKDERIRDIPVIILSAEDKIAEGISSSILMATMGQGFSATQILGCSLQLSKFLLEGNAST